MSHCYGVFPISPLINGNINLGLILSILVILANYCKFHLET